MARGHNMPEGGGFKSPANISSLVLLPLIRSKVDVPIIAAGGISDGVTMAAAFALGAEGVQMGTRMVSSTESPVHEKWKNAIFDAGETGTVFINRKNAPAMRVIRTEFSSQFEYDDKFQVSMDFEKTKALYFGGDMQASLASTGQVCGRIDEMKPVKQIVEETVAEFFRTIKELNNSYVSSIN